MSPIRCIILDALSSLYCPQCISSGFSLSNTPSVFQKLFALLHLHFFFWTACTEGDLIVLPFPHHQM